ncbi:hypothetical protein DSO57_1022323 [Entomophthora muscae]|uniref:Uncharacterized protein n=1 Tax=Entomophthora muscae TaxID=34485 RepID=A0ACC2SFT7_9FUNG|nr:hypothetical protein DSO57_1022323 [Entomophthora muscae]
MFYPAMTLAHWDEPVAGIWELHIHNRNQNQTPIDRLIRWKITFYGRNPTSTPATLNPVKLTLRDEL